MLLITNGQKVLHCKAYKDTWIELNLFQAKQLNWKHVITNDSRSKAIL